MQMYMVIMNDMSIMKRENLKRETRNEKNT